ncbi:MAG: hypothetical protein L3J24_04620 [Xanthomonadales bacterium]|nr:hypothetical protein [Xanthomonadales bacterium]
MKRILLILAISTPLLLTACKQSDETTSPPTNTTTVTKTKSELFEFVPADTPYLFANLESIPSDVTDAYLKNALPLYTSLRDNIAGFVKDSEQLTDDTPTSDIDTGVDKDVNNDSDNNFLDDTSFAHLAFVHSILNDLINNPGIEGIEKIGFSADAKSVIYGLGLFPVVRMEIGDEARLRATLEKAFTEAGGIPEEKTLNGRKYWQAGNDQFQLITSIDANEFALSFIPTSLATEALPNILAQSKPENQLDLIKSLTTLNQNNDYTNYGSGWLDTLKLFDLFLNSDSSAASTMRQMLEFDAQSITQICRDEYNSMAATYPRMHSGYHSLSPTETKSSFTIELQQELANDLQSLVIADALSTTGSGGLLNIGFALNFAKAREWLLETAKKRVENPYKCEQLAGLNQTYAQAYEGLNRPMPPFVGNLIGFKLFIDELDLGQIAMSNPVPQKIKAMLALLTSNPEMLVGMGQMFLPELAELDLSPGADPVELTLEGIPKPDEPVWAAISKSAIGVAAGEGMHTKLLDFLADGGSKGGEFISVGIDGEFQSKMEAASTAFMQDDHSSQTTPAIPPLFERLYISASFTSKGIVINQTTQLKK